MLANVGKFWGFRGWLGKVKGKVGGSGGALAQDLLGY